MGTTERKPVEELEGRELDEAIQREVFSDRVIKGRVVTPVEDADGVSVPHYSLKIPEAWRVYQIGCKRGWWNGIITNLEFGECYVVKAGREIEYIATAKTESLAICRAALKVVREG